MMRRAQLPEAARKCFAVSLVCALSGAPILAGQMQTSIGPERPDVNIFVRPYTAREIPPIRLANSTRLRDLVRAGKLYLTVQDAVALALENNIDLEIARYNPLINASQLERAQAGGPLPGVPSSASQAGTVAAGQGVSGSQAAAGVSLTGNTSNNNANITSTISQIGPVTPTLDPTFQLTQTFSHRSSPQPNTVVSDVLNLIQNTRNFNTSLTQGLITGGQVSVSFKDSYLNENAPTDVLNPSSATVLQISAQQNFLQGFGIGVNSRNITVAKANLNVGDLQFKAEVISTVANTLNLYYGLVADYEDVKAKQSAVQVAQQFYENNQKQVQVGAMAPLDVTTAEAQVASAQQDLVVSQTNLDQQQVALKNALSRNGLFDPLLADVQVIPLDHIEVPEKDNLPPLSELINTALRNRTDIGVDKINLENAKTSALGTMNGVLPQLAGIAAASSQGLAGQQRIVPVPRFGTPGETNRPGLGPCPDNPKVLCEFPDPYFIGGIGTALGQTFRRNFPTQHAGGFLSAYARNQQAQADYAIDQLSLKQTELENLRSTNQITVDVSNQVVGLQQARIRYQAAVHNRILQQQLLDAEQKKFALGASTTFNVVQQQRDLETAQSSEIAALVTYSNAHITLDEALGITLETNHVSLKEAQEARVSRPSTLPASLPAQP
ncbi:MAG: TolC family protein [Acidobacteriaceae bacterium]|nr:TolC family protein [Acidobacteriaceae bacterium]